MAVEIIKCPPLTPERALAEVRAQLGERTPTVTELVRYIPDPAWFARDPFGIHGIGHEARVLVLGAVLGRLLIKNGISVDEEAMRWFASTHDVCRLEDGPDVEHGARSSLWIYGHMEGVIPENKMAHVSYLNRWHVPSDLLAPNLTPTLKAAKESDGLDRVRDTEWGGLCVSILRYDISRSLMAPTAMKLHAMSTTSPEWAKNQVKAVMAAAVEMEILRNE